MLRINIASLEAGVHHVDLAPTADEVELPSDRFRDIHVAVRLDRRGARFLVDLEVEAIATLECDRTLVLFDQSIGGSCSLLFAPPDFAREQSDWYEEVRVLQPSDQEIDLTTAVRDTLLLAVPVRCVAPGAEDADIPTQFGLPAGDTAEIDPRWEALRKLHPDDKDGQ
jgi:uncharacterized protein